MFRALAIGVLSIFGIVLLMFIVSPEPVTTTSSQQPSLAKPDIERAVQDCGTLLGFGADTIMTQERVALLTLCLRPELKQITTAK